MKNFWQKLNKPILALAPMAGFTDSAFRQICQKYGADVVYSEMASVSGLYYSPPHQKGLFKKAGKEHNFGVGASPKRTLELLKFNKSEHPYVVQLFGSNPEHFAKATQIVTKKIKPDGIDINFGCPVKKVMKTGAGCALMLNYKLAREIIKAVCNNTNLPVSLKIRTGYRRTRATDFIKKIKDLPFQAVMVHCRTYEQGFSGTPDYSIAEKIKKIIPDKIVLVNGGINSAEDAVKILKDYPAIDGLGIARGALGHPWIFEEVKKYLKNPSPLPEGRCPEGTEGREKYDFPKISKILLAHAKLIYKNKGLQGIKEFRAHVGWYIKGFPGASEMRRKLVKLNTLKELTSTLKKF
jgi:tRNA-dihydrouridine synthase B